MVVFNKTLGLVIYIINSIVILTIEKLFLNVIRLNTKLERKHIYSYHTSSTEKKIEMN